MIGYSHSYLSLLKEEDVEFQCGGIEQLLNVVDREWHEIASSVQLIESFAMDLNFPYCKKASFLVSKLYYYLNNLPRAADFAVRSGDLFNPVMTDVFTRNVATNLLSKCVQYVKECLPIPDDYNNVLQQVLKYMHANGEYASCLCLAIETNSLQYVKISIKSCPELTSEAIRIALTYVQETSNRNQILKLLVDYVSGNCSYIEIVELHHSLQNPRQAGVLLSYLLTSEIEDNLLIAYQIAFDMAENAGQNFRSGLIENIPPQFVLIKDILTRKIPLEIILNFNCDKLCADKFILEAMKTDFDTDYSQIHMSVIYLFSLMYASTGTDTFYRENTPFFGKSSKWARFFAIASVGSVHSGHLSAALAVLDNFLKPESSSENLGGALYALGLIYVNYIWDDRVLTIIRSSLMNSDKLYVQYGACLAIGLVALGSQNMNDFMRLKEIIIQESSPESGEAAGYGLGMVMLGSGASEHVHELLNFATDCEHEKPLRGLSMGFALMSYGLQEEAEVIIETLLSNRKPVLREGGAMAIALAYVGTGSNRAIERLLHIAVSDVNGYVRRVAVIGVGFVLSKSPNRIPEVLGLISKSYHPYVRSGAALAIGISCAGYGNLEAIELLKPLVQDPESIVQQSAIIGMAMLLQQQSDASCPHFKEFRKFLRKNIHKRTNEMTTFAISAAYGILYASGRNAVISCNTIKGENSIVAIVGLALFTNFFYFTPLAHMLSLSLHSTALIGIDITFTQREWYVLCKSKPSCIADPPPFQDESPVEKKNDKATLSITKKLTKEEIEKERIKQEELKKDFEAIIEPSEVVLQNPARVNISQLKNIDISYSQDYIPITGTPSLGIVMLKKAK